MIRGIPYSLTVSAAILILMHKKHHKHYNSFKDHAVICMLFDFICFEIIVHPVSQCFKNSEFVLFENFRFLILSTFVLSLSSYNSETTYKRNINGETNRNIQL